MRKRTDANHAEIMRAYKQLGATVCDLSQQPGTLDLLVGIGGITDWIEVKDGSKPPSQRKLTEAEQQLFDIWKGRKPVLIESLEQVADHVAWLRGGPRPTWAQK